MVHDEQLLLIPSVHRLSAPEVAGTARCRWRVWRSSLGGIPSPRMGPSNYAAARLSTVQGDGAGSNSDTRTY